MRQGRWAQNLATIVILAFPASAVRADHVDDLIKQLSSPHVSLRSDAAEALVREKSKRAIPALITASGDAEESVRGQAVRALASTLDSKDANTLPPLLAALQDKSNGYRRAGAATLLGIMGDKRAANGLAVATKDANPLVRSAATEALGTIGDPRAGDALRPLLSDPNPRVRLKAAAALGRVRDKASVTPLLALLRDSRHDVQSAAAVSLAAIGDKSAVPTLLKIAQGTDTQPFGLRFYAAYALGALGDKSAAPMLIAGLKDQDKFLRRQAANALGMLRDARGVEPLTRMLHTDSFVLARWNAAQALGNIARQAGGWRVVQGLERPE